MGLRPLAREACAWSSANIVLFFFFKLSIDELWPNNYVLGAALANWLSHFRIFLNKTFILSLEWLKGLHRVDYMRAYNLIRTHYFGQKFEYCLRACMVTLNSVNFHALTKTIDLLIFIDIYWYLLIFIDFEICITQKFELEPNATYSLFRLLLVGQS